MGLIKQNYEFKGFPPAPAYARVQINTERKEAIFYIGSNRENAFTQPAEKIKLYGVPFTHVGNPFKEAYEFAKGQRLEIVYDQETGEEKEVMVNQPFHDWQNDII